MRRPKLGSRGEAISSALSSQATVATVAGAVSGGLGLLVGVLSTRSAGATRFSDVGVFATVFTTCGAFLGVVITALSSRMRRNIPRPGAEPADAINTARDESASVIAPLGREPASAGSTMVQRGQSAAPLGHNRPPALIRGHRSGRTVALLPALRRAGVSKSP
jgi:hypothetical protein